MPTNLKNLLSRSRSRNELKGRGEKEECSCTNGEENCTGVVVPENHYHHDSPPTCQCQSGPLGKKSDSNCQIGTSTLRRDISTVSLFSLPGEDLAGSRPASPASSERVSSSTSTSPYHSGISIGQARSIRKCETVLALSSFTTSSSFSSGNSSVPSGVGPTSSRVRVMKDRILSTSSSALGTLLQNSNKTTSKLLSGWKLSAKPPLSSHLHHQPTVSPSSIKKGAESSKSQLSIYETNNPSVPPLTPMNRLRRHGSLANTHSCCLNSYSRCSSLSSVTWTEDLEEILCRLCLYDVKAEDTVEILACSCRYCKDCVIAYVSFEVQEGAYDIACPDAKCEKQGVLSSDEIEALVPTHIVEKHKKFRLFKDVETDSRLMWCPTAGCETICRIKESEVNGPKPGIPIIQCPRCQHVYCTDCRLPIHSDLSCDSYRQKLIRQGKLNVVDEEPFAAYESIKKCPFCHVPIEKDSGCAQMMCKRCKHVFCWYCLASLDDDFLLRHYDKGPCKNKLGHSRASVVWHRTQVIGIFAGFGLLVLLASPLLILAAPCLLCCRCRHCTSHLDADESPVSI